jgi:alanine dehydrogenase
VAELSLGLLGTTRKENEFRLPIHPQHFERIDPGLRERIFLEHGYGERFGASPEELSSFLGGMRSREELIDECDIIVLPKPLPEDLAEMREGQVFWGWPHCVQDEALTQIAIERRQTLIAWEAMNYWMGEGSFRVHVFHKNNELAGYCSVLHAMQLLGITGEYGRRLRAAVISLGSTGRGAVTALSALGVLDINALTHRNVLTVTSPSHSVRMVHFENAKDDPTRAVAIHGSGPVPVADLLAEHDVVVNCVLQDTDSPLLFVMNDEVDRFAPGSLIVDVSVDEGMGFEWARPTTFDDPIVTIGNDVHYYAVDHSPSYLWNSSTWEISDALLPHIPTVMGGPEAWNRDETIRRAIEIRDGVVQNPKILSFQGRAAEYPHNKL